MVRRATTNSSCRSTTHLSIVDKEGNAVSFTATVEAPFGSGRWVEGFLLNNEMTDFAREVPQAGPPPANAIQGGKRPRSSMSPTMLLNRDGELVMVTGSPGGNSIPAYVSKSILGVMAWNLSPEEAVGFPNVIARGQKVRVEIGVDQGVEIASELKAGGYQVEEQGRQGRRETREQDGERRGALRRRPAGHRHVARADGADARSQRGGWRRRRRRWR